MPAVFVHVSDIHFGQEKGDDRVHIHNDVKQQLISDARQVVSNLANGVAHGILVTGDIAQSGTKAEYDSAAEWLDQLASSIGAEIHCVQMVPGNHDLDRSKLSLSGQAILDHIRTGGPNEYEQVLNNPVDRAALFARFEDYGKFSFGYNCPLNDEGAFASELEVNLAPSRSIRFIRLNSSLLCHGKERDEDPELMIGARQFVIPRDNGIENVILVHHPLSWYKDQDQVRQYVRSRARVFISGHEHDPKVFVDSVDQGCDVLMLAAGATVPYHSDDVYTFTYNIIEFDWDEEIDGLSVTIHPRVWNPQRTCFENDDKRLGGKDPNYRLNSPNFRVAPRPEVTPSSSPTEPLLPVVENTTPFFTEIGAEHVDHPKDDTKIISATSGTEGYEIARLRFFRDLFEGERLRILAELGALSENFNEQINQGIERRLLDLLVREGKLEGIEKMIEQLISDRKEEVE